MGGHLSLHQIRMREAAQARKALHRHVERVLHRAEEQARKAARRGSRPALVGGPRTGHPAAAKIALRYLGVPYVWGGASPSGFDASGLVKYVYAKLGVSLPHYTVSQWNMTAPISRSRMKPGDLVFFHGLGHVGIYIGHGEYVDAPHTGTVVRIESLAARDRSFDGGRRVS